jgi:hypothetical protein
MKFHVKPTSGSLVDTCRRTDGRTDGYHKANRRICRLCEGTCQSYVVVPSVFVVPCTIGKYVQTHSKFSVSSNTFRQISPLFGGVSAGCIHMRILPFLCNYNSLPWNVFPLIREYVYKYLVYSRSGTYCVRWFWKQRISLLSRIEKISFFGKRQFYVGTYSWWKDLGKEMEFLASQWATERKMR